MCSFFDVGCHVQLTIYETWAGTSWLTKFLIVGGLVGLIVALCWSFLKVLKSIGGWPAVGAAVALILGAVLMVLPRKPKGRDAEHVDGKDGTPSIQRPRRKGGKRVFDVETNTWKDV